VIDCRAFFAGTGGSAPRRTACSRTEHCVNLEEVDHAGDGFFVAFGAARPAIECGVAIQRTLLDHRRRQGFAPQVRIGIHAAPAQKHDGAYRGKGVHAAAREILASCDTIESAPPGITLSTPRTVTLKGLWEPLEVVTLGWR